MHCCPFEKIHPSALKKDPNYFMSHMLSTLAIDAWNADEVPVGAVMVHQQEIISSAHNQTRSQTDPTAHAEMIAITMAAKKLGDWRLNECQLYVTKEPHHVLRGRDYGKDRQSILRSRRSKMGCLGGATNLHELERSNHKPEVFADVLKEPCEAIIQEFFSKAKDASLRLT